MLWVPSVVVPFDPSLSLSAVLIMYDVAPVCYQHDIEGSDGAKRSSCSSFSLPPSADRPLLLSAALLNRSPSPSVYCPISMACQIFSLCLCLCVRLVRHYLCRWIGADSAGRRKEKNSSRGKTITAISLSAMPSHCLLSFAIGEKETATISPLRSIYKDISVLLLVVQFGHGPSLTG